MASEERLRIFFRELRFCGQVEADVLIVGEHPGQQRRLACLTRTGDHYGRKVSRQSTDRTRDVSREFLL